MDISIVDKFISNSITIIQNEIKNNLNREGIIKKIKKNLDKLTNDPNISKIIIKIIQINIIIFFKIYDKEKLKANIDNSESNLSTFKYISIFNKIKKLFSSNDIKDVFEKIDQDEFLTLKILLRKSAKIKLILYYLILKHKMTI